VAILGIRRSEHPDYVGFETAERVRRRLEKGGRVLVADLQGRSIGTVTFRIDVHEPSKGEIARLAVLPAFRGTGIGRVLMGAAESALGQADATVAEVSIVANFDRLRSYYEAMGYARTRQQRFAALPFDVLFLEKRIPWTPARRQGPPRMAAVRELKGQ
jgi:GNAT superfamily N-acetyltransferase